MKNYKIFSSTIEPEDSSDIYITTIDPMDEDEMSNHIKVFQQVVDIVLITLNQDAEKVAASITNVRKIRGLN